MPGVGQRKTAWQWNTVCCKSSTIKQRIFDKYPRPVLLRFIFYIFCYHRGDAKILSDQAVVLRPYRRQKTVLSKPMPRKGWLRDLCSSGNPKSTTHELCWWHDEEWKNAAPLLDRNYGSNSSNRTNRQNGKTFSVYKFRTMHPYAEFSAAICMRITTPGGGKVQTRYPCWQAWAGSYANTGLMSSMLINLIKGDMRNWWEWGPLKKAFSICIAPELQQKNWCYRPGLLLPHFIADMQNTG